jgi:hypothetical protein
LDGTVLICHPAVMARARAIREAGGYRAEAFPAEDADLWLRIAETGKLANLPEILLKHRQHFQSIGNAQRTRQVSVTRLVIAEARRRRGLAQDGVATPPEPTRPAPDATDQMRKWAWWAFRPDSSRRPASTRSDPGAGAPSRATPGACSIAPCGDIDDPVRRVRCPTGRARLTRGRPAAASRMSWDVSRGGGTRGWRGRTPRSAGAPRRAPGA